jgi:hypothetical protein
MDLVATEKLQDTIDFINEWKGHGDLAAACVKFKVDPSHASKILKGKVRKPKAIDFLKYLKEKAQVNYSKLRL